MLRTELIPCDCIMLDSLVTCVDKQSIAVVSVFGTSINGNKRKYNKRLTIETTCSLS